MYHLKMSMWKKKNNYLKNKYLVSYSYPGGFGHLEFDAKKITTETIDIMNEEIAQIVSDRMGVEVSRRSIVILNIIKLDK